MIANSEYRFLVVDDFEMMRVLVRKALKELGYQNIDEASNGRDALAKIIEATERNTPYTIVLCDWMMPEVSGLDVIQSCRARPSTKDLPIIMVTAESERREVIQALKAGATDYLVKPVSVHTLQEKINRTLQRIKRPAA